MSVEFAQENPVSKTAVLSLWNVSVELMVDGTGINVH
jgi:hypothetical protein